ncbi:MAG: exodeoxyribonuclease VII small subunit [Deltaproteobacteria bacterium]
MAKDKFEDALQKLESIVKKMESGELSLDESLKAFEEGVKLARFCAGKLDEAQRKVEQLSLDKDQEINIEPFLEDGR